MTSHSKRPGRITVGSILDPDTASAFQGLSSLTRQMQDMQKMWELYNRSSGMAQSVEQIASAAALVNNLPDQQSVQALAMASKLDAARALAGSSLGELARKYLPGARSDQDLMFAGSTLKVYEDQQALAARRIQDYMTVGSTLKAFEDQQERLMATARAVGAIPAQDLMLAGSTLKAIEGQRAQAAKSMAAAMGATFSVGALMQNFGIPSSAAKTLQDHELAARERLQATLKAAGLLNQHLAFLTGDLDEPDEPTRHNKPLKSFKALLDDIEQMAKDYPFLFSGIAGDVIKRVLWTLLTFAAALAFVGHLSDKDQTTIAQRVANICEKVDVRYVQVRSTQAPIQAKQDRTGKILFYAHEGDTFCAAGRDGNWLLVQQLTDTEGGSVSFRQGWVSVRHVAPIREP